MVVRLSAYAPTTFTPRKYSWYSFLLEADSTPGPYCLLYWYLYWISTTPKTCKRPEYLMHYYKHKCSIVIPFAVLTHFTLLVITVICVGRFLVDVLTRMLLMYCGLWFTAVLSKKCLYCSLVGGWPLLPKPSQFIIQHYDLIWSDLIWFDLFFNSKKSIYRNNPWI